MFAALRGERAGFEAVMQQPRTAAEQPGHHGQREPRKRARGAAAEQASVRLDAAFEQGGKATPRSTRHDCAPRQQAHQA